MGVLLFFLLKFDKFFLYFKSTTWYNICNGEAWTCFSFFLLKFDMFFYLNLTCFGLNLCVLAWTYVFWLERRCFGLNLGYLAYHFWLITFDLSVLACHFWLICEYNSWVGFFCCSVLTCGKREGKISHISFDLAYV